MEELLEGLLLAAQELDVVHQEDVDVAVAAFEVVHLALRDGRDEIRDELLGGDVLDVHRPVQGPGVVADGVQQVRLAQPRAAVDEQRVVSAAGAVGGGVAGLLGDLERGREGEAVGIAHDVVVEGIAGIEVRAPVEGLRVLGAREGGGRVGDVGRRRRLEGLQRLGTGGFGGHGRLGGRTGANDGLRRIGLGQRRGQVGGLRRKMLGRRPGDGDGRCGRSGVQGRIDDDLERNLAAPDPCESPADDGARLLDLALGEGRASDEHESAVDVDHARHPDDGELAGAQLGGVGQDLQD